MPYVRDGHRQRMAAGLPARNCGDLNYQFTIMIDEYCKQQGLSYQTINDVLGALSGAEHEFYRRVAGPYENGAIERNGDVYSPENLSAPRE